MAGQSSRPLVSDSIRARFEQSERAWLRVYLGAAPGVGKTYQMLRDGHLLRDQGVDVAIGFIETYGRLDTEEQIKAADLSKKTPGPKMPKKTLTSPDSDEPSALAAAS